MLSISSSYLIVRSVTKILRASKDHDQTEIEWAALFPEQWTKRRWCGILSSDDEWPFCSILDLFAVFFSYWIILRHVGGERDYI